MPVNRFRILSAVHPVRLESSVLAQVAYDRRRQVLDTEFRDGSIYQYLAVPMEVYQELLRADSKGVYFNRSIRGHFSERMLRRPSKILG